MIYNDFQGIKLSALGFGAMRLPVINGDDTRPDPDRVAQMVDYALAHGVNYFDTAWGYHGGHSEEVLGAALARHPRASFYLASKFPGYDVSNFGKHEDIFEEQLQRAQVDHFDFYLLHNVCELNIDRYLDDATFGTVSYFLAQRAAGRIKHLGFSVHGNFDTFLRFMNAYGDQMEFCQVQLNYEDWDFQKAKDKVAYLNERGLGIIVMEPLRGGNLVKPTDEERRALDALHPGRSAVDWAFRYVQSTPGVITTLSGMSSLDQLKENVEIFSNDERLSPEERAALEKIGYAKAHAKGVPCTACHYCTSHCPLELDIPRLLELYNEQLSKESGNFIAAMALKSMPEGKRPSACIACGSCEVVCPQQIDIPDTLAEFAEMMGE